MKHSKRSFLAGILVTLVLCSLFAPVSAAGGRMIEVFDGVNVYVNDVKIEPKGVNGQPVDVFIYNGTTYLPIRAIGEALKMPVQWDGSTNSAYVGSHATDHPSVWIKDLNTFTGDGFDMEAEMTDNLGNTHYNILVENGNSSTYVLNGQYSAISGTLFQNYEHRSWDDSSYIEIYGDGELLLRETVTGGVMPKSFKVDLTGALH